MLSMTPFKIVKKVQRLIGRLTALSIFIARLGERRLPFFQSSEEHPQLLVST
jgi:hypothetical protein